MGIFKRQRICVPGNHDILQDAISENLINHEAVVAKKLNEKEFNDYISNPSNNVLLKKFDNYRVFEKKFANIGACGEKMGGGGWKIDENIGVYCLNTALCSSGGVKDDKEIVDEGRLAIDTRDLQKWVGSCDAAVKILVMHHPKDWLTDWAQNEFKNILNKNFSLCLSGHVHNQDILYSTHNDLALVECSAPPL